MKSAIGLIALAVGILIGRLITPTEILSTKIPAPKACEVKTIIQRVAITDNPADPLGIR